MNSTRLLCIYWPLGFTLQRLFKVFSSGEGKHRLNTWVSPSFYQVVCHLLAQHNATFACCHIRLPQPCFKCHINRGRLKSLCVTTLSAMTFRRAKMRGNLNSPCSVQGVSPYFSPKYEKRFIFKGELSAFMNMRHSCNPPSFPWLHPIACVLQTAI